MEIYKLPKEEQEVIDSIIDPETGEVLDEELLDKIMKGLTTVDDVKNENLKIALVKKIKIARAGIVAIEAEIQNLKQLKGLCESREANTMKFLKSVVETTGDLKTPAFQATIKQNPAAVLITDESKLESYTKIEIKEVSSLDKRAIAADLKAGKKIDGAELTRSTRLDVK